MVLLTEICTQRSCGRVRYSEMTDDANTHWHVRRGVGLVPVSSLAEVERLRQENETLRRVARHETTRARARQDEMDRNDAECAGLRRRLIEVEDEWRNTAHAAKGHYEQSDDRLARVEAVCADAETMQWADVSESYGEGVRAMAAWVREAATAMPGLTTTALAAADISGEPS